MTIPNEQLEKFLELAETLPDEFEIEVQSETEAISDFIYESADIAVDAVR